MINLVHNEYAIEIFSDELYSLKSTDNVRNYNFKYGDFTDINNDNFIYAPKYGVILKDNMGLEKSAILFPSSGTGSFPHKKSALVDNENLLIIAGDWIFNLSIPELKLNWQTKCGDCVTCFELFAVSDGYIVHGECSILKVQKDGRIAWEFSGRDIFTTVEGIDIFKIVNGIIMVKDWQNYTYKIDLEGKKQKMCVACGAKVKLE
jgi:hypothetical protein